MHSLRDVYCRKLLMKKKTFLGPFFFCTFLPFVPFYPFVPLSVLPMRILASNNVYQFLDFSQSFVVVSDASNIAIGDALLQQFG